MADPTSHTTLDYSTHERVAHAAFSRPERLNSLSEEALDDLGDVVRNVQADVGVRALVISGSSEAFSVGLDDELLEKAYGDPEYFENVLTRLAATCLSIESLDVPVVAQVAGKALGEGFELALACDLIVAADEALIGDGQTAAGIVPGGGASIRLPRVIGVQQARELIYSGRLLSGGEAAAIGLVLKSVPAAELEAAVAALVATFTDKPRSCLATAKRQINRGLGVDTPTGVEQERRELIRYLQEHSPDAIEGFRARRDGREPSWA
ncbi:MAG TPA: enoyl-CoA hydratase/isomerase family protein [Solirubrobacteraceae bacterium]|nr:enoyl-CoA hydratase/isomerase family protein [Solirubrobacteraceae bacterium]